MLRGVNAIRQVWRAMLGAMLMAAGSCDRIKQAVGEREKEAEEAAVREELEKLVDQNEEGVRFRHDLPFPERVRCRVEKTVTFTNGRMFAHDAFGEGSSEFEGTMEQILLLERDGAVLSLKIERNRFGRPVFSDVGGESENASGQEKSAPPGMSEGGDSAAGPEGGGRALSGNSMEGFDLSFIHREDGWRQHGKVDDFRAMAIGKQIEPVVGDSLGTWGMVPRSPWFGGRRFVEGMEVTLTGKQIGLITGTRVKSGKVTLQFEGTEALEGHPCGVFAWSGDFDEELPNLEGERQESEVSVSEGRLWCSLLHPVVLRSESKGTITLIVRNSRGKLKRRIQGAVESNESWQWNPLVKGEGEE